MKIKLPYGKELLQLELPMERINGILESNLDKYDNEKNQLDIVKESIKNPIGSLKLSELSKSKDKVIIIASDHTRPVPSKIIIPLMLGEIRKGNSNADITILIATGCHRGTTKNELINKFGEDIVSQEKIIVHDCETSEFISIGTLPSGGNCLINKLVTDADLVVSEGFIEPHFFAGFSGGRKSILPGVASKETVLANHCSEFINNKNANTGILKDNPIHEDMIWAAKKANLEFIVNVILDSNKKIIHCVSGDVEKAHLAGCNFLLSLCKVKAIPSQIVISTNGGYPLDQNVYQAVKGMTAAEATVRENGVIIMVAKSNDGIGGNYFYNQLSKEKDINKTLEVFLSRSRNETESDQWQTQIFIRILKKAKVIFVSDLNKEEIRKMHMIPAVNIEEALNIASEIVNEKNSKITIIPDGVSVMVI
jgi:nickel-dependent lactate racemase